MSTILIICAIGGIWAAIYFAIQKGPGNRMVWYPMAIVSVAMIVNNFAFQDARSIPQLDMSIAARTSSREAACVEATDRLVKLGLIRDSSTPGELTVNGDLWKQLPGNVQQGILTCVGTLQGVEGKIEVRTE